MANVPDRLRGRWCIDSTGSFLSIRSRDSILSIGSVGSALSIGSIGSFASAFSIGSSMSLLSAFSNMSRFSAFSHQSDASLLSAQSRRSVLSYRSTDAVRGTGNHRRAAPRPAPRLSPDVVAGRSGPAPTAPRVPDAGPPASRPLGPRRPSRRTRDPSTGSPLREPSREKRGRGAR